jgi:hypothetical protein
MHSYASDSRDRKVAPWVIAGIAIVVAFAYSAVIAWQKIEIPWWVETPSIMSVYGIVYWLYNRCAWKWRPCGLRLSEIPNFSGTWFGELHSNHAEGTKLHGMMHVHQTWTDICVEFDSQKSRSYSLMAAVNVTPGPTEGLTFQYTNAPRHDATETMNAHVGLNHLRLLPDGKTLEGDYFSGRGRQTFGRMKLMRIAPERMTYEQAEAASKNLAKS